MFPNLMNIVFLCLLVVSTLALCQVATAQSSERAQIVAALDSLTSKTVDLRSDTDYVNPFNAELVGPRIVTGIRGVAKSVRQEKSTLVAAANKQPLAIAGAVAVKDALKKFVAAQDQFLEILIKKHSLTLLTVPYGAEIRDQLKLLQRALNTFSRALVARIPTQKAASANTQFANLDGNFSNAIREYSEPV